MCDEIHTHIDSIEWKRKSQSKYESKKNGREMERERKRALPLLTHFTRIFPYTGRRKQIGFKTNKSIFYDINIQLLSSDQTFYCQLVFFYHESNAPIHLSCLKMPPTHQNTLDLMIPIIIVFFLTKSHFPVNKITFTRCILWVMHSILGKKN